MFLQDKVLKIAQIFFWQDSFKLSKVNFFLGIKSFKFLSALFKRGPCQSGNYYGKQEEPSVRWLRIMIMNRWQSIFYSRSHQLYYSNPLLKACTYPLQGTVSPDIGFSF
jgi:hypothetical protein